MSNRLIQGVIHQMTDVVNRVIGVIDENGVIVSCSELVKIGETRQGIRDELAYTTDAVYSKGYTYRPIGNSAKSEYVVFVEGEDELADKISAVLAISLSNIKNFMMKNTIKRHLSKISFLTTFFPVIYSSNQRSFIFRPMSQELSFWSNSAVIPMEFRSI